MDEFHLKDEPWEKFKSKLWFGLIVVLLVLVFTFC